MCILHEYRFVWNTWPKISDFCANINVWHCKIFIHFLLLLLSLHNIFFKVNCIWYFSVQFTFYILKGVKIWFFFNIYISVTYFERTFYCFHLRNIILYIIMFLKSYNLILLLLWWIYSGKLFSHFVVIKCACSFIMLW